MSLVLILAALLSPQTEPRQPPPREVERSLSDTDRLKELEIQVRSAHAKGHINRATAAEFYGGIARVRRQMFRMGMQVGYRQKVALRQRIDRLYARWEQRQAMNAALNPGK